MYHITNFQAFGLCANVKKIRKNWHWIYLFLALIYFQRLQNKKNYAHENLQL